MFHIICRFLVVLSEIHGRAHLRMRFPPIAMRIIVSETRCVSHSLAQGVAVSSAIQRFSPRPVNRIRDLCEKRFLLVFIAGAAWLWRRYF